ncbi:MAG: hypothetical protein JXR03_19280 [Cyclobacteriaceae bacterium]
MKTKIFGALLICALFNKVIAQDSWTSGRPDGHAPIGVMGDHTHGKGDFMFSYRFMYMNMDGMRDGSSKVSSAEVLTDFMVTPETMPMNMHMFGLMYAISDKLTVMAMTNYTAMEMDHITRMGVAFTTKSSGIGDLKISGLYNFFDKKGQRIHANLGLSIPVGSIDNEDVTPASGGNKTQLPYPMQIGTGTWDVMPGLTYMGQKGNLSWGAQAMGTFRIGKNDRDYAQGNKGTALGWIGYKTTDWLSFSAKLSGSSTGEISGGDPVYTMPMLVPTVNADNFGGEQVSAGIGFNIYIPSGALKNIRLGVEFEAPIYQNLNGPQMNVKNVSTIGLQYSL